MGQLRAVNLGAPGSYGQNTQSSSADLPAQFGTAVLNAVVDESGRLAARKSLTSHSATNVDLGSAGLKRVYRHNKADGTSEIVSAGNNRIFTGSATLTSRSSGHSADRWQFATLNGTLFAAQAAHSLRRFNETTWAETTQATPSNPLAIHAAYGRLWALSSDGWTLSWSDLLDGSNFTTGASGSLDLNKLMSTFRTAGVAVASFNNNIVVLCRNSILLLGLAQDLNPNHATTPIYLREFIPNIGCIARDSVVSTGDDLLFMADDGLRSLGRSMQVLQGPAPMTDASALNQAAIISGVINAETQADITAAWYPNESWYLLFAPTARQVWLFDLSMRVPEANYPRTLIWSTSTSRPAHHALYWTDGNMYFGGGGGLFRYTVYDSNDSYTFTITTGWLSLENPIVLKHFKKVLLNLRGGGGQTGVLKWYVDFDDTAVRSATFATSSIQGGAQYNVSEYNIGEYTAGVSSSDVYVHISNSAKFVKFSIEIPITGSQIAVNNMQAYFNQGRIR